MRKLTKIITLLAVSAGLMACANCTSTSTEEFPLLGELASKKVREAKNDITVGCETLDRDYADYHQYKGFLTELGVKKIRLQAGWAKTEKVKGVYDFEWLDRIIDDAYERGLTIMLETSYGNPIYNGGGTPFLSGGWPSTPEALKAWDNWVRALAERYKDKVAEWEMWNEPDINKKQIGDGKSIVDLNIRTAEIIRSVNPDAKIAALAMALLDNPELSENLLAEFKRRGKLDMFDWITYHQYMYRPEDMYPLVDDFNKLLAKYSDKVLLRQAESGAPSVGRAGGALSDYDWTELSQAKWALRRMMGDRGRNIQTCIFCIADMNYAKTDAIKIKNHKGLLRTDENNRVIHPKMAYKSVQNLVAVYDYLGEILPSEDVVLGTDKSCSKFYFKNQRTIKDLNSVIFWFDGETPLNTNEYAATNVSVKGAKMENPVLVDLLTGEVRQIPAAKIEKNGEVTVFKGIPVYDSPQLIMDLSLLKLTKPQDKILTQMEQANRYFFNKYPDPTAPTFVAWSRPSNIWTRAVYFEGLMAMYSINPRDEYYDYALRWAEFHNWGLDRGTTTRHADDQCAGQTYIDLYNICPDSPEKIKDIKACMDMVVNSPANDDWYWIDAIQMAMPVLAKLSVLTGDSKYSEKMWKMYEYSRNQHGENGLYNPADGLWWRDKDFDPPYTTPNGKQCYWSRGNGWVFAALARVMDIIPTSDPHFASYRRDFVRMAKAVKDCQREDGFWNPSLVDQEDHGGKEGTATGLFTYGLAWGIRNGYLAEKEYLPVALKGWNALAEECLHPDGALGYMQGRSKSPKDGLPLEYDVVHEPEDFALGCFLLAGSEMYKLQY